MLRCSSYLREVVSKMIVRKARYLKKEKAGVIELRVCVPRAETQMGEKLLGQRNT